MNNPHQPKTPPLMPHSLSGADARENISLPQRTLTKGEKRRKIPQVIRLGGGALRFKKRSFAHLQEGGVNHFALMIMQL